MLDEPQTNVPATWPDTLKGLCVATLLTLVVVGPVAYWVVGGIAVWSKFDFPVPDDPPMPATVPLPPELAYDAQYWQEFPLTWHRSVPGSHGGSEGVGVFGFESPGGD